MKLATVEQPEGTTVVAEADGEVAILRGYRDLDTLICEDEAIWRPAVEQALNDGERLGLEQLRWLPPVRRPGKVLCVALNNSANPDRIKSGPDTPAMFTKPSSALVGHRRAIVVKDSYGRVHPEPELAVVIGRGGADIAVEDAIARANASDQALGASVWGDKEEARKLAERIESGTVWINQHGTLNPMVPFGGVKDSGYGLEFGAHGLKAVANPKVITF